MLWHPFPSIHSAKTRSAQSVYRGTHGIASLLIGFCLLTGRSEAEDPHVPLARSDELHFAVLLPQALRQAPEFLEIAARDEEARHYLEAARSWLAGRPSWEVSYLDDRPRSSIGLTEWEYGLQIPLWRQGEKRDAQRLGGQFTAQADAWKHYLTLTIAGQLRDALADLDQADRLWAIEQQTTTEAQQLVASVEKLFAAGELAQLDVMQARALLLQQQRQELEAKTSLSVAEARYTLLTGLVVRPLAAHREEPSLTHEIDPQHPWLRFLNTGVGVAEAAVKQARLEARGSPSLLVGSRRQRGSREEAYHDSLLVSLSVPFGASAHVAAQVSSAHRARTEAEVQWRSAQRQLDLQLRETRRELDLVHASLRLSEEQVALDHRQGEMARAAFEVGEITLFQVLTTLRQSRASAREHEILKLKKERLVMQLNQLLGVLP